VLRPIGPRGPRVYWFRRSVVIGLILVLIIVVAEACAGGGSAGKPPPKDHPVTHPTASPTSSQVAACDPTALTLVLSTDSDTYTVGQTPKLIGVFSNTASSACTLSVSPSAETWTVKSGPVKIWTTQGCTSSDLVKQVKIKAGGTKTISTFWDGDRLDPGCAKGPAALRGEYTLSGTLDGVKGKIAVFHITS
jgi:hypothetical protein